MSTFKSLYPNFSLICSFANPNFPVLCLQYLTKYHSCGNTLKFCNKLELTASIPLSALLLNSQQVMVGLPSSPQKHISRVCCSLPELCAPFHSRCCPLWQKHPTSLNFKYSWCRNITFSKRYFHMLLLGFPLFFNNLIYFYKESWHCDLPHIKIANNCTVTKYLE